MRRVAVLVTLFAFIVYLLTLAPSVTWRNDGADGGELIAAVVTGGVAHPSGYPTYLLLGSLFVRLPIGDIAHRLNLMSAAAAAGAAGLTLLAALASLRRTYAGSQRVHVLSGGVSALTLAFSSILWSQAVISEVYALNAFFTALVWYLLLEARAGRRRCVWPVAAAVFGVGLGNHLSLLMLALPSLVLIWATWRRAGETVGHIPTQAAGGAKWRTVPAAIQILGICLAFVAGLAVYVALPLRAAQQAPVNWGGADTWDGFVWLVTGRAYGPLVAGLPVANLPGRALAAAALLVRQAAWWGVPVAYFGVRAMWQRDRSLAVATLLHAALVVVYAVGYNTADSYVYLIPAAVLLALWIAWGLPEVLAVVHTWAADLPPRGRRLTTWMAGWGVLLLVVVPLAANWQMVDANGDRSAYDYGVQTLTSVPENALIVADSGVDTFPLWYFRYVEVRRPDVAIVNGNLLAFDWYRASLRRWHPAVALPAEGEDSGQMLEALIEANLARQPVYLTSTGWDLPPGLRLVSEGTLYRVVRP